MPVSTWERYGNPASTISEKPKPSDDRNLWEKVRDFGGKAGNWLDSQAAQEVLSKGNPALYRSYVRRMQSGESVPASEMFGQVRKVFDPGYSEATNRDRMVAMGFTAAEPIAGWAMAALGGAAGGAVGSAPGAAVGATAGRLAGPALLRTMANVANPEAAGRNILWDVGALAGGKALGTLASARYRQALQPMLARKYPRAERVLNQMEKALDPLTGPAASNPGLPRFINRRLQGIGPQGYNKANLPMVMPKPPTTGMMPPPSRQQAATQIPYPLPGKPTGQMDLGVPNVPRQGSLGLSSMRQFQPTQISGPAKQPLSQGDLGLKQPAHQSAMPGIGNPEVINDSSQLRKLMSMLGQQDIQLPQQVRQGELDMPWFGTRGDIPSPPGPPQGSLGLRSPVMQEAFESIAKPVAVRPGKASPYRLENMKSILDDIPPEAEVLPMLDEFIAPKPVTSKVPTPTESGPDLWTDYFKRNPIPTQPKAPKPVPITKPKIVKPKAAPKKKLSLEESLGSLKPTTPLKKAVESVKPLPKTGNKKGTKYYKTESGLITDRDPLNQKKKGILGRFSRVEYDRMRELEPRLRSPEDVIRGEMENYIPNQVTRVTSKSIGYVDGRSIPFKIKTGVNKGVLRNQFMKDHADLLNKAMRRGHDVNARTVDFFGPENTPVPEGYIRKGAYYVKNQGQSVGAYSLRGDEGGVSIDAPQPYRGPIRKINMAKANAEAHYVVQSELGYSWDTMDRAMRGGDTTSYAGQLWRIFQQVTKDRNPPHFSVGEPIDLTVDQLRSLRPLAEGGHWKAFWAEADRLLTLEARRRQ